MYLVIHIETMSDNSEDYETASDNNFEDCCSELEGIAI